MSWFQVTNPAIDPLREGLVMSLEVNIGKRGNILELGPENASQVILSNPVLNEGGIEELMKDTYLKPKVLSTFFDIRKGVEGSLQKALYNLCEAADDAVRSGSQLLILSDRIDSLVKKIVIQFLQSNFWCLLISQSLALSGTDPACNPHNVSCWSCSSTSYSERLEDVSFHCCWYGSVLQHTSVCLFDWIWCKVGWSSLVFVLNIIKCFSDKLWKFSHSAVCPYLALETCRQWRLSNKTVALMRNGKIPTVTIEQAQKNYTKVRISLHNFSCLNILYIWTKKTYYIMDSDYSFTMAYLAGG